MRSTCCWSALGHFCQNDLSVTTGYLVIFYNIDKTKTPKSRSHYSPYLPYLWLFDEHRTIILTFKSLSCIYCGFFYLSCRG